MNTKIEYRELRFVVEPELTQVYVRIEETEGADGLVQGWHHKTFPALEGHKVDPDGDVRGGRQPDDVAEERARGEMSRVSQTPGTSAGRWGIDLGVSFDGIRCHWLKYKAVSRAWNQRGERIVFIQPIDTRCLTPPVIPQCCTLRARR